MKVIVGLGNPGPEYKNTRHNAGFMILDELFKIFSDDAGYVVHPWEINTKWDAEFVKARRGSSEQVMLLKPHTFMNNSGLAVQQILHFYRDQINPDTDLLVIFDDLDLPLGTYKLDRLKFPRTHKGVISINQHLHQLNYYKVRIGVDNRPPENRIDGEAYVLQQFTPEELNRLKNDVYKPVIKQIRATLEL